MRRIAILAEGAFEWHDSKTAVGASILMDALINHFVS